MQSADHTAHSHETSFTSIVSETQTVTSSPQQSTFKDNAPYGDHDPSPSPTREVPAIIPPTHSNRTLILCFDGTGDQFDNDNSNIVQLFSMLKKDDRDQQMCYYQAGIGTYTSPQVATPLAAKVSKTLDEMIAWNLGAHVMDGYEFLMQNYKAGDRICIFGFSRGAYTARALAGMIHKVGLLPACNHQQVPFAFKMFTQADEEGWKQSNGFKKAFSVDVDIEFVGVWDTVNSVGLIPRRLPFTTSNTIVRTFRHAVALDERRAKFKANHWNRPTPKESVLGITNKPMSAEPVELKSPGTPAPKKNGDGSKKQASGTATPNGTKPKREATLKALEKQYSIGPSARPTDIEEVWFAGCHCDVGGGSVDNDTPHSLARIALRWMIRECFKSKTGIMFESEGLRSIGLDPASLYPFVEPRKPPHPVIGAHVQDIPPTGSNKQKIKETQLPNYADVDLINEASSRTEEDHELLDAMSPIYDQLALAPWWWILELFPMKQKFQKDDNSWDGVLGWNLGRGRFIPKQKKGKVRIHRSVKMRMEAEYADGRKYEPKASFERALGFNNVIWVD